MKISLALGFFDGVHLGHRRLLMESREYALNNGLVPAVYTFENDMKEFFGLSQLYSFSERAILLKEAGADLVMSDVFSDEIKNLSGKEFLDRLTDKYDIGAFFCGYDYAFGHKAECNAQFLANYATHNKIYCRVLPEFCVDGNKVSTTTIKECLKTGAIEEANALLGRPYFIKGNVLHGRGVGSGFGYPTANIEHSGFLPKEGVYKTVVKFDGTSYKAVTNVGAKPTFGIESVTVESMLLGFNGSLYGKEIEVEFIKYLRPIYKFKDGNELKEQIEKDTKEALC